MPHLRGETILPFALFLRAFFVWLVLLVLAVLNGTFRQAVLLPRLGDGMAHVVSTLLLSAIIFALAFFSIRYIHPQTAGDARLVGLLWVVLTVAFEFGAGHYLFGNPWPKLLADYNLAAGRIWVLVLLADLAAPVAAFWLRARS